MQMTEGELADLMEEVRPVKFVSLDGVDEQSDLEDQSLHEIIPDDSCVAPLDALERKKCLVARTAYGATTSGAEEGIGDVLLRKHAPL